MATITKLYLEVARGKLALKENKEITDYALAKKLGISTSAMHQYMKTERECDNDEIIMNIADLVDVSFFQIMGEIKASKARSNRVAEEWRKLSKGMIAGVSAATLAGALTAAPTETIAAPISAKFANDIYYVKLNISRFKALLLSFLQPLRLNQKPLYSAAF